ncbi:hypothetical protein DFH06DRAFT_1446630 [Mycena polygramma]|nr:hypothetical protein DFH06DRAFT_1446630 [Mycena polygramma]
MTADPESVSPPPRDGIWLKRVPQDVLTRKNPEERWAGMVTDEDSASTWTGDSSFLDRRDALLDITDWNRPSTSAAATTLLGHLVRLHLPQQQSAEDVEPAGAGSNIRRCISVSIAVGLSVLGLCSADATGSAVFPRLLLHLLSHRFFRAREKSRPERVAGEVGAFRHELRCILHERLDALALGRTKHAVFYPRPTHAATSLFHLLRLLLESPRAPPLAHLHSFSQYRSQIRPCSRSGKSLTCSRRQLMEWSVLAPRRRDNAACASHVHASCSRRISAWRPSDPLSGAASPVPWSWTQSCTRPSPQPALLGYRCCASRSAQRPGRFWSGSIYLLVRCVCTAKASASAAYP